jgi:hypothetical protein
MRLIYQNDLFLNLKRREIKINDNRFEKQVSNLKII